jgi:hypothetical protein
MDIFSYEAKIKTYLLLFLLSAVNERGKSMARGQMNSAQIERCLGFLGQKLADMQINAKIILLGGAVMVTQLGNRNATQDIDAVIATNDRQVYQAIQQAIAAVAREKKLAQAWLNDDVTIVVDQVGKPKAPRYWKTYGSLDVYIPELVIWRIICQGFLGKRAKIPHTAVVNISDLTPHFFVCTI